MAACTSHARRIGGTLDRRYANPVLVTGERAQPLERVPFEQRVSETTGKEFDEGRLQRLIFETPELLPIADIEPAFDLALPLAREVPTEVGPIDLLFVNPRGYLTIVETKLWRNPEARREVVGQIVDYAKELSRWDVERLVASVAGADETKIGSTTNELYEYVRTKSEDLQEQEFLDSLAVSLREGRVLLLIAGDGVRESVESIAEFLDRFPQLHFKLALVELLLYELESGLLVVPQVLTRTREIERAVVRDKTSAGTDISLDLPSKEPKRERRRTLTETDFLSELARESGKDAEPVVTDILGFMSEVGLEPKYQAASFTARLPYPTYGPGLGLFLVQTDATIEHSGHLGGQLKEAGLPESLRDAYARAIDAEFDVGVNKWGDANPLSFSLYSSRTEPFKQVVRDLIREIQSTEPSSESPS